MTSFTAICNLEILDGVFNFFYKVHFSSILLRKYIIILMVDEMSSHGLTCLDA